MPMGIVSDSELNKELGINGVPAEKDYNMPSSAPKEKTQGSGNHGQGGRKEGDVNVPESLRNLIADEHATNGRVAAVELANSFGVSASSADAYASGRNSTASDKGSGGTQAIVNRAKERIAGKARRRLNLALNEITEERLSGAKLKDVASVARDMAVIMKQMEPEDNDGPKNVNNVQVVLYAPPRSNESDFGRVVVND